METPSPAPATPAPAPSAPPSAPTSTPAGSTPPSTPTKYGEVPKSRAQEIWSQIDQGATAKTPSEEAAPGAALADDQIPEAAPPETPAPGAEPAAVDPLASPNEATLPPRLRESLKSVADPKVRAYLADAAHMRATLSKTGLPFAQLQTFIAEAPEYLQKAPTVDVLNQIAATAEQAGSIATDFTGGTEQGFQNFSKALIQANPEAFVGLLGFLFNNIEHVSGGMKHYYGEALGRQVEQFRDGLMDRGMQNLTARMRADAQKGGDFEVLAEVADELEKYLGLKERVAARAAPQRADPRDLRIQALEAEKQSALGQARENFQSGVFNQAGNTITEKVQQLITQKASGFSKVAQSELVEAIGSKIFSELLNNPAVKARVDAIYRAGKWDQAHAEQIINFYVSAADRLIGIVAPPALNRMAQLTGSAIAARKEKVAAQIARKDPGASGSPPIPRIGGPPKSSNPKDIFDFYDKHAEARAGVG